MGKSCKIDWSNMIRVINLIQLSYNLKQTYLLLIQGTFFYPTALKGCWGIVFTHGVQMGGGGWAAGKVCPACISETVRCRKLVLGRDIG